MRIITVLYDQSAYTYRWLKPLFAAKNEFKLYGYKVDENIGNITFSGTRL